MAQCILDNPEFSAGKCIFDNQTITDRKIGGSKVFMKMKGGRNRHKRRAGRWR